MVLLADFGIATRIVTVLGLVLRLAEVFTAVCQLCFMAELFANSVSWQKVDKNGNVIEEEEDDITQGNGNVDPNSGETPTTPEAPENPGTGGGDGDDSGVIS